MDQLHAVLSARPPPRLLALRRLRRRPPLQGRRRRLPRRPHAHRPRHPPHRQARRRRSPPPDRRRRPRCRLSPQPRRPRLLPRKAPRPPADRRLRPQHRQRTHRRPSWPATVSSAWSPATTSTGPQLAAMLARIDPSLFECVIHQHMPMFHMEHCVFAATLSNGKDFHDCGRPVRQPPRRPQRSRRLPPHPPHPRRRLPQHRLQRPGSIRRPNTSPRCAPWACVNFRIEMLREDAPRRRPPARPLRPRLLTGQTAPPRHGPLPAHAQPARRYPRHARPRIRRRRAAPLTP